MVSRHCTMEPSKLKGVEEEWMEYFADKWYWCSTKEEIKLAILCAYYVRYASLYKEKYADYHNTMGQPCKDILFTIILEFVKESLQISMGRVEGGSNL
ncbi:hypothetical protein [Pasteuria penetrans]|uniref:hypothetical protein n=1 Tax=Pasteuria penetrans TaxID=86005 RepID=UPI000FAFAC15|nr:hypothetical protein [Pasteuria penetrans]